jgi:formiminotetrahydrofolate cyclodeaminase
MLIDMTVKDFLAELKSASPAPGGGSAAALAGAVGAALALMVGNLTVGNAKYQSVQDEVKALLPELEEQLARLQRYVDEDTAVFNQVMAAYRLPKATEEEIAARSRAIQQALEQAASLPMTVAGCCQEVLVMARRMLAIGNANAASDAAVAGRMAHAAMWAAIYNVRINLGSIKDQEFAARMRQRIDTVLGKADAAMADLLAEADKKIGG